MENPPREGDHLCMSTRAGATLTTTGNATIGVKGRSTCNAGFIENDRKVSFFFQPHKKFMFGDFII